MEGGGHEMLGWGIDDGARFGEIARYLNFALGEEAAAEESRRK